MPRVLCAALAAALLATPTLARPAAAQTATHVYELNGSLADANGGPSLVALGGILGATGYTFAAGQGLTLENAVSPDVYSLEFVFSFATTSGYRKLVDFKNGTSDNGLYVEAATLRLYPEFAQTDRVFSDDQLAHVVLTRDAASTVTGFVNGASLFQVSDVGGVGTFSFANAIMRLFVDDRGGVEQSAGYVDYLRVYDAALTAPQVAVRFAQSGVTPTPPVTTTPEPASLALLAAGAAVGVAARRARRGRARGA